MLFIFSFWAKIFDMILLNLSCWLVVVVFCVPLAVLTPHDVLMAHHGRCEPKRQSNGKSKKNINSVLVGKFVYEE